MKKILIILLIAAIVFGMSSCEGGMFIDPGSGDIPTGFIDIDFDD
jgi:hypothetical protein